MGKHPGDPSSRGPSPVSAPYSFLSSGSASTRSKNATRRRRQTTSRVEVIEAGVPPSGRLAYAVLDVLAERPLLSPGHTLRHPGHVLRGARPLPVIDRVEHDD